MCGSTATAPVGAVSGVWSGLELVVVVEAAEVYPQAAERAVVVLAVSTAVDGGFAVAVALVVGDCFFEFGDSEVQFVESAGDSWSDVEFSEL